MNKSYDYIMGGSKFSNLFDFISGIIALILYLIFDYPHKHYTFKHFEV